MKAGFLRPLQLLPLAAVAVATLAAGMAGLGQTGSAQAQGTTCATAPFSANTEASAGVAFVDVGQANTASFVCINTPGFPGGTSGPLTANGAYGDGCYFVEGIGTSVVAVYWELPDVRPDCQMITNINVGTGTPTGPTAAPTVSATAPAPSSTPLPVGTATPAATNTPAATAPAATPTRAATMAPTNPTAVPTAVAPAPTQRPPSPPRAGNGQGTEGSNFPLIAIAGLSLLAISGATIFARKKL